MALTFCLLRARKRGVGKRGKGAKGGDSIFFQSRGEGGKDPVVKGRKKADTGGHVCLDGGGNHGAIRCWSSRATIPEDLLFGRRG